MAIETWLLYAVTVFFVSATPGPNMLLAMTHGIQHGFRPALVTSLGLMSGLGIVMGASSAGLGALLAASEQAFVAMKLAGAAYLIYLGVKVWRADPERIRTDAVGPGRAGTWARFRTGVLVSISNPKAFVFFTALFPQFLDSSRPQAPQFAVLVTTFVVIESAWQLIYAGGGARLAHWLDSEPRLRLVNRLSGGAFVAAGLLLTAASRRGP